MRMSISTTSGRSHAPQLAGLALTGVVIAVLGALIPARSAARLTIARVLHNE
ncbi:hypothetical protein ACIHCQ_40335 [Streptomyces sp. NPDC052236]|uniref:hypothetical protein n=1 Tax=Streptomyces sp. NPDC052236 TaxID=3365686 RepID=UPI0037D49A21